MALRDYRRKRHFQRTPEPAGQEEASAGGRLFVVQKHAARRLHYDFRLELEGVLKSWAVPKGPSLDPTEKHLAVQVEDHPVEYADFEGIIPEGEYGGGTVLVWDRGRWEPVGDPVEGLRRGRLKFRLHGEKLQGGWNLIRLRSTEEKGGRAAARVSWLLFKERDLFARPLARGDVREEQPLSVLSGRTLQQVAGARDRVWSSEAGHETARRPRRPRLWPRRPRRAAVVLPSPDSLPGARPSRVPAHLGPQLATLVKQVPAGNEWLHEVKLDGYRLLARLAGGEVTLLTRRGLDWTASFPTVASALRELELDDTLLDGEVVVLRPDGTTDFQALQNLMGAQAKRASGGELTYFVFDVPFWRGHDLRHVPLLQRKQVLEALFEREPGAPAVRLSKHVRGHGPDVLRQACSYALEGIISKRADSVYESRRSPSWLKIKCVHRQELVIGGFTDPAGSRSKAGFGALLLGFYDDEHRLVYCGKVGTGFNASSLARIGAELRAREAARSPFQVNAPGGREARAAHWVRPELVAEVEFTEWTDDGLLRHPSFEGLREDKPAGEVHREQPIELDRAPAATGGTVRVLDEADAVARIAAAGVHLTHAERVLYPDANITKAALAAHYLAVEALALPHVRDRPLAVVRCPNGQGRPCFFQKHHSVVMPRAVGRVAVREQRRGGAREQLMIEDLAGLLALVQMSVLEIHPWGCRADDVELPDVMVFDLDPGPGLAWAAVLEAAVDLRDRLRELGLESFVKTSGGKGLHVQLPLRRRHDWDEHKAFAQAVAEDLVRRRPQRYLATASLARRPGHLFIDYLRNARGATSIAPYSTRARPGAPVSTPLRWDELPSIPSAQVFTLENLPARLAGLRGADPWEGYLELKQSFTVKAMHALGLR